MHRDFHSHVPCDVILDFPLKIVHGASIIVIWRHIYAECRGGIKISDSSNAGHQGGAKKGTNPE
jgi:hypothetical protein